MKLSRSELSKKYNLSKSMWERRHDELLDWMNDFFSIKEIKEGRYYYYEIPDNLPDTIPNLPRKSNKQEKILDYEKYVDEHLPIEFTPLSKAKMSRDAILDFGQNKYNHNSSRAVSERYVGPAMEKLGEKGQRSKWVDYLTYIELNQEQLDYLTKCFSNYNITEEDVTEFGYEIIESGIVDNKKLNSMKDRYDNAITQFRLKYGFKPVRARDWRKKREEEIFYLE